MSATHGSSPLTRGKRPQHPGEDSGAGLIPAHAGKTFLSYVLVRSGRAHPRSRGENHRARGDHTRPPWLIPAHAGKTTGGYPRVLLLGAHPRSRGENASPFPPLLRHGGSSPLTRGKPAARHTLDEPGRLIPAHAGKTLGFSLDWVCVWAHPRSRGENTGFAMISLRS